MGFANTAIVGLQKKYYSETFKRQRKTLKQLAPMLRALSQRSPYLSTKWTTLDDQGKMNLSAKLQAHAARVEYTLKRNEHYEARMKQSIVGSMLATVQRQYYFEAKLRFFEKESIEAERRRMRAQEAQSNE